MDDQLSLGRRELRPNFPAVGADCQAMIGIAIMLHKDDGRALSPRQLFERAKTRDGAIECRVDERLTFRRSLSGKDRILDVDDEQGFRHALPLQSV